MISMAIKLPRGYSIDLRRKEINAWECPKCRRLCASPRWLERHLRKCGKKK